MDELISWPEDLRRQAQSQSLIVFVGAGVSMSSTNNADERPPNWEELLRELSTKFAAHQPTSNSISVNELIDSGRFLEAADALVHRADLAGDMNEFDREISRLCDGPSHDRFQPSSLHDAILDLQPSIIVTTNFDRILERAGGEGYTAIEYYEPEIDNHVRQQDPTILKLHGTCGTSSRIVFSERQYAKLPTTGRLAIDVLRSLLLTRMALFIGYSANDPDLKEVLRNIFSGRECRPGHVLAAEEPVDESRRALFSECYGITIKEFPRGQFGLLEESIKDLSRPSCMRP